MQLTALFTKPFMAKKMLAMKLTAIMLVICLQVSAGASSQTITYSAKNAKLESILTAIKKQSGYVFFYKANVLKDAKPVTIEVKNANLIEVLKECFKDQPFTYTIEDKTIVISPKEEKKETTNVAPNTEVNEVPTDITVAGKVVNENGEPVIGASILIKGTKRGTSADNAGLFTLNNVDENAILVISGTNIQTVEVRVSGRTNINITTKIKVSELGEVVISAGYYKTTKDNSTGDIARVTSKDFDKQGTTSNPLMAIQGRMPGVTVVQTSGVPGSTMRVEIRGRNSIRNSVGNNGNFPLYIIDGVPVNSSTLTTYSNAQSIEGIDPLNTINPDNIESLEVLKDADATAIYGSRGANGVVLITTKRGKQGKSDLEVKYQSGWAKASRFLDLLSTRQYLDMRYEAYRNDGVDFRNPSVVANDLKLWDTTSYTDWQRVLYGKTARIHDAQLSLSGGNANTSFRLAAGYHKESTVFPADLGYSKAMGSLNINHLSTNKKFEVNFTANYGFDLSNLGNISIVQSMLSYVPVAPQPYDKNGNLNWDKSQIFVNPLIAFVRKSNRETKNLLSNLTLRYELLPGLNLRSNFGYTDFRSTELNTYPKAGEAPWNRNIAQGQAIYLSQVSSNVIAEPQITYSTKFKNDILDVVVGSTFQETSTNRFGYVGIDYVDDNLLGNILAASTVIPALNETPKYRYAALFGRLGYNHANKYLLNITARRDGSSRFGPGKRFGNFGAIGTAWIFSREKFMEHINFLSFGKIRGSYGTTGSDAIADYGYVRTYGAASDRYDNTVQLNATGLANPNYSWEVNKKLEFGVDLRFLDDKVEFSASWFRNRSSNQLVGFPIPSSTGFTSIQANLTNAVVENRGWEFSLGYNNNKTRGFNWSTNLNFTIPTNQLLSYPNILGSPYRTLFVVGQPLSNPPGYQFTGVNPTTGLYTVRDLDGNGVINTSDYVSIRNRHRNYYGGLLNTFSYGAFELNFLIEYVNQWGTDLSMSVGNPVGVPVNFPVQALENVWRKPGDMAARQKISQANFTSFSTFLGSDYNQKRGYFIRMKTTSISYEVAPKLIQRAGLSRASLFLQAQNLFTITNFVSFNPETPDSQSMPILRTISAGLKLNF